MVAQTYSDCVIILMQLPGQCKRKLQQRRYRRRHEPVELANCTWLQSESPVCGLRAQGGGAQSILFSVRIGFSGVRSQWPPQAP